MIFLSTYHLIIVVEDFRAPKIKMSWTLSGRTHNNELSGGYIDIHATPRAHSTCWHYFLEYHNSFINLKYLPHSPKHTEWWWYMLHFKYLHRKQQRLLQLSSRPTIRYDKEKNRLKILTVQLYWNSMSFNFWCKHKQRKPWRY